MSTEQYRKEETIFGGGCFWCTEAIFTMLKGIISLTPGYAGGTVKDPSYDDVCTGKTGHAEVIKIEFDPSLISFEDLLNVFFATHDPTTPNRQGNDIGTQYRSIFLYTTDEQKMTAEHYIMNLNASHSQGKTITTEVKPLDAFYEAEDYHKNYFAKNLQNPYCEVVINPKLRKAQEKFSELLKKNG